MSRIGVFVCHCGENISRTVDVERVATEARKLTGVAYACDYKYMCSDPGQNLLKKAVSEHNLDGIVVAACSPRMHEKTFRKAAETAGLNPFLVEMANIREHCSWVHEDKEEATAKATEIVTMLVERVKMNKKLQPITVPITKRSLVIGGGIAGIQAALDIADCGHQVVLVEREPSIGGHMAQLSETFPTLDCSQCIMTPKMVDVANHPNITLHTYSEIESVDGYIGNFTVTIKKKARSVDMTNVPAAASVWPNARRRRSPTHLTATWGCDRPFTYRSPRRFPTPRSSTGRTAPGSNRASAGSAPRCAAPEPLTTARKTSWWSNRWGPLSWPPALNCTTSLKNPRAHPSRGTANSATARSPTSSTA